MLRYVVGFFTEGGVMDIVSRAVSVLLVTMVYFLFFYYAKKRNLRLLTYVMLVALAAVFALSFFGVDNLPFYVYFVVGTYTVCGLMFFTKDFRRDIFRLSLKSWLDKDQYDEDIGREDLHRSVTEIIKACQKLSRTDTGALLVIADNISDTILDSGTHIGSEVSAELLETLFFPKTPLHDGAVVITANKVIAAGCYLPLSQENNLPREFGTRHRAAIGVSEAYPGSTTIVVSEETGIISAMHDGKVKRYLDAGQLQAILECAMRLSDDGATERIWGIADDE